MTTKRFGNGASIYRVRVGKTRHTERGDPPGICQPQYREFKLACLAAEIPARQRAVDDYWDRRYAEAAIPADKINVLMEERYQRSQPCCWPPTPPGPASSLEDQTA